MKKFLMMIATVAFVACTPITDSYDGETLSVIENVTVECVDVLAELFGDVVDDIFQFGGEFFPLFRSDLQPGKGGDIININIGIAHGCDFLFTAREEA